MNRFKGRQPAVVGAGLALLTFIVLVVMVMPKMSAVGKQRKDLETAQQTGQQLATQVAELRSAKKQASSVEQKLHELQLAIPDVAALPRLIRQVQHIADVSAVDFVQVSPGTPSPTGSYSTIPTQISTTGSYFAVTEFLYDLENLPRAVKVTNITVGPGPTGLPQLALNLTAEVYTSDTSSGPGSKPGPSSTGSTGGA